MRAGHTMVMPLGVDDIEVIVLTVDRLRDGSVEVLLPHEFDGEYEEGGQRSETLVIPHYCLGLLPAAPRGHRFMLYRQRAS